MENLNFLLTFKGARTSPCHEFVNKVIIDREGACDEGHLRLRTASKPRGYRKPSIHNDFT